jgi:hypothetical protein
MGPIRDNISAHIQFDIRVPFTPRSSSLLAALHIDTNDRTLRFVIRLLVLTAVQLRILFRVLVYGYLHPVELDWHGRDWLGGRCGIKCRGVLGTRTDIDYS